MLLLRLWNYIRGYVIILVEGYFLEKFINICTHRQILMWDVKRHKNCVMTLKVSIKGFRLLRPVARKTRCRVRIVKKRGLPFTFNRYKRRKAFVVGAVIFILLISCLSSFVWKVEVTGNTKLETGTILEKLSLYGVRPGILKYNISTDNVVNNMMLDMKELAWVGVVVKGTKVKVQVVERVQPPVLVPKDIPCNIIARRDGVVKSVVVKEGLEKVETGDTVIKGQLLISGTIDGKDSKTAPRIVHALGYVKARTWYEKTCPVSTKLVEKERTGDYKDNYSIGLFGRSIKLFPGKIGFVGYEKVEIRKSLSIGEDIIFPFEWIVDRYYEENLIEREIDIEDAKNKAVETANSEVQKDIPEDAEVVKASANFISKDNGELVADVVVECLEEIGVTKEIGGE